MSFQVIVQGGLNLVMQVSYTLYCSLPIYVINLVQYLQFLTYGANANLQILQRYPLHVDYISKTS